MFKPNSVIVYVKDVDASTEFYTKILGRPIIMGDLSCHLVM